MFIVMLKYTTPENQRFDIFKQSIESLIKTTKSFEGTSCPIVLIDNGKTNETYCFNLLRAKKIHAYTRLHTNIGLEAFNGGFEIGRNLFEQSKYFCFTGDDILFKNGWLEECVGLLEKYPTKRLLSSPVHGQYHLSERYDFNRGILDGHILNERAGANCRVLKCEDFLKIGKFGKSNPRYFQENGIAFTDRLVEKGYLNILTKQPMAEDLGKTIKAHPGKGFRW